MTNRASIRVQFLLNTPLRCPHRGSHPRGIAMRARLDRRRGSWSVACSWPVSVWGSSSGNSSEPQAERLTTALAPPLRTLPTLYAFSFARAPFETLLFGVWRCAPRARERTDMGPKSCANEAQIGAVRAQRWQIHATMQACAAAQPRTIPRFASSTG